MSNVYEQNYKNTYMKNQKSKFDPNLLDIKYRWEIADDNDPNNRWGTAVVVQKYDKESTKVKIIRYGTNKEGKHYEHDKGVKISTTRPEVLKDLADLLIDIVNKIKNQDIIP